MEKKEFIAVVVIAAAVIFAAKKVQQVKVLPQPALNPQREAQQEERLEEIKLLGSYRPEHVLIRAERNPFIETPTIATVDLGSDFQAPLPPSRHFYLFDLSMMLQSQVIIEPFVEKFALSAPNYYIESAQTETHPIALSAAGRLVLTL